MGKVAFVFSGQGAQYPGMGESLCQASPAARQVFALADAHRPGTSEQCFHGTAEELAVTENTQPCVYCVDLAAGEALREAGVEPDFCAGFSLGEVAALAFAGVFPGEEGFALVCRRAEAMQKAGEENPGAMAAVLKLPHEKVEELCGGFTRVWPVNYNCPGQLVVAGNPAQIDDFCGKAAQAGGRAKKLAVSGGFHTPFMESAGQALDAVLGGMEPRPPRMPVYANATARPYGDDVRAMLVRQVQSPVRWQETIEALAAEGVDTFFECGPGKTLCGLIKKICREARAFPVQDGESLQAALDGFRG